ncbi:Complement receptor type 2 [Varanus komodoensis]|nr:Complement receptor type 2 [Varanus komodoensis]
MVLSAYCSSPPRVDHGKYSALESAKYTNGASVKYSCESAMRCPFPPKILHGKYIERDFRYGQSIRYKCDTGYSLVGEELVTCILAGSNAVKWSETPKCKVVQCKLPPSIENGAHSNQGTAVFTRGMSVQYTCKPGYTLTGEANLYCSDSGTWSPLPPHCEAMHCPLPPVIDHGTYTGEDFRYGQHAVYICDAGYSLVGEPLATCILEGSNSVKWSEPPQCKVTGCVTPDVQNGKVTLSEEEGRITIRCNPGYFLKGNHTIQCTLDRMWDSPPPTCVRDVQCQPPPFIQNGGHSSQQAAVFTRGMVVTYTCDSGYNLTGEKTIYCTDLGTWSSPAPRCEGTLLTHRNVHCGSGNAINTMGKYCFPRSSLEELKTCLRQLPKLRSLQIFQNY